MEERIRPSRSGLFAIELVAAVGIFTFCAALCVGLFVHAELLSRDSADLTRAVTEARSVAECWKAAQGNTADTAQLTGGFLQQSLLTVFYDRDWNRLTPELVSSAAYQVELLPWRDEEGVLFGTVTAGDLTGSETFLTWQVAALEAAP